MTALLVARPFVLGEDPGMLASISDATNMILSLFWLVAIALGAGLRAWSRQGGRMFGAVEIGLLAIAGMAFVSAALAAPYKHPAWMIAWEWLILALVYGLIRQLARTADDLRHLVAVLLATGVCLSAYAVYQYTIELPSLRSKLAVDATDPESDGDEELRQGELLQKRLAENNIFATYAHPNTFASFVALLFPACLAGAWSSARYWRASWQSVLACGAALVVAAALWMTHSRGAILGTLLVGIVVALVGAWPRLRPYRWALTGSAVVVAALVVGLAASGNTGLGKAVRSLSLRRDYWAASWRMIGDHPFLGVGPGNFGRFYPLYMLPTAFERIQDPHNFLIDAWATMGLFGMVAMAGTLAAFCWRYARSGRHVPLWEWPAAGPTTRWEFYLGAMGGLLLGFLLRAVGLAPDDLRHEGNVTAFRSVLWFGSFAFFASVPWKANVLRAALAAGLGAVFLNLLISGGIGAPSLMQLVVAVAALCLSVPASGSSPAFLAPGPKRWLPVPILAALAISYFLLVFQPVTSAQSDLMEARLHYAGWREAVEPRWREQTSQAVIPFEKHRAGTSASQWLKRYILDPLQKAQDADPGSVLPLVELAQWQGEQWKLFPGDDQYAKKAVSFAVLAQQLDPQAREPYLAEYHLRKSFAERLPNPDQQREQYGFAARSLLQVVERDPTDARLRLQLAEVMLQAGDRVQAARHAEEANRLDELATHPSRRLTEKERQRLKMTR